MTKQNMIPPMSTLGINEFIGLYLLSIGEELLKGTWVTPEQLPKKSSLSLDDGFPISAQMESLQLTYLNLYTLLPPRSRGHVQLVPNCT